MKYYAFKQISEELLKVIPRIDSRLSGSAFEGYRVSIAANAAILKDQLMDLLKRVEDKDKSYVGNNVDVDYGNVEELLALSEKIVDLCERVDRT